MVDWLAHKARREYVKSVDGQGVWLFDKDWEPVCDLEDWLDFDAEKVMIETGNLNITVPGWVVNPATGQAIRSPIYDELIGVEVSDFDNTRSLDWLFHSSAHIVMERPGQKRRCYRVLEIKPGGGREFPTQIVITGLDSIEYLKHLPLWADPSNRSKVVQMQFEDKQEGTAERVSRKLIGRNLIGYHQASLLGSSRSWTDSYSDPAQWRNFIPERHPIVCSPVQSGIGSEWTYITARWDNAFDLMQATWHAAGIMPVVDLWLPGDPQPFPEYCTLTLPCMVIDFLPRAMLTGAVGRVGQVLKDVRRRFDPDDHVTSVLEFADANIPTSSGDLPWVVFEFEDAPEITIRKSTDKTVLVGGKSPKIVNTAVKVGIRTVGAALVSLIPGIGPAAAELIKGGVDMAAEMAADRFLNLNETTEKTRAFHHGRSAYTALSKPGEANSPDSVQKTMSALEETKPSMSVSFPVDDFGPYTPGVDFGLGDTVGVAAWGTVFASYCSAENWTSSPDDPVGSSIAMGNYAALGDIGDLVQLNNQAFRARLARNVTTISS